MGWDTVVPLVDGPGLLVFAAVGTVGFDNAWDSTRASGTRSG